MCYQATRLALGDCGLAAYDRIDSTVEENHYQEWSVRNHGRYTNVVCLHGRAYRGLPSHDATSMQLMRMPASNMLTACSGTVSGENPGACWMYMLVPSQSDLLFPFSLVIALELLRFMRAVFGSCKRTMVQPVFLWANLIERMLPCGGGSLNLTGPPWKRKIYERWPRVLGRMTFFMAPEVHPRYWRPLEGSDRFQSTVQ